MSDQNGSATAGPDRTGWLSWQTYLSAIETDGHRLAEAASARLDAPVPSCPGWTTTDLLDHTTEVYLHKIACMRQGSDPDPWPPPRSTYADPMDDFRAAHVALQAELLRRDPDERRFTWWEPDQTNGFWYRRMALETAIHRVDAELATAEVTPIADALALDGIDEMLCIMLAGEGWDDDDDPTEWPVDAQVRIEAAERAWTVDVGARHVSVTRDDDEPARTTIAGAPHDLYVWLWGRGPVEALTVTDDPSTVTALRGRLGEAGG